MKDLTIGIPCYNEASTIGKVVDDFANNFPGATILVIDNASTDDTGRVAREHGAAVICEYRKGKGFAVQRLFQESKTALLLMVDGDDTYPAEEAPKLIGAMRETGCDTVVGRRTSTDPAAFKSAHTWANDLIGRVIERIFGQPCGDLFSGFRLFSRTFYCNVPLLATGFEVETELALQTLDKGFAQRDVDINFRSRPEGSFSKLNTFQDGMRVLRVLVALIKDYKPLLFFVTFGVLLALASLTAGFFPILDYIRYQYIYRVPLAVLSTGLGILSGLAFACGLILDTVVRHRREDFSLRMRRYRSPEE